LKEAYDRRTELSQNDSQTNEMTEEEVDQGEYLNFSSQLDFYSSFQQKMSVVVGCLRGKEELTKQLISSLETASESELPTLQKAYHLLWSDVDPDIVRFTLLDFLVWHYLMDLVVL